MFQFYALSAEESQAWIDVLHAAISKFKPQQQEFREGGNMHNPDRQGFLMKQGHGALNKGFKERYVALKGSKFAYYETKEVCVSIWACQHSATEGKYLPFMLVVRQVLLHKVGVLYAEV